MALWYFKSAVEVRFIQYARAIHTHCCKHSKNKTSNRSPYKSTLLLPKTNFRQWLNSEERIKTDKAIYKDCKFAYLYEWQRKALDGPDFVLHDGPPYANGVPHMGHAINKILKDITIRHKILQGKRVHYVSGWDCHGLPIELKATGTVEKGNTCNDVEIRSKAREFAKSCVLYQKEVFATWGITTDWNNCYYTCMESYIKNQLNKFFVLFEKGLIYRALKPVYWSPSSRTALAEAELEYEPHHKSQSVTVRFPVECTSQLPSEWLQQESNCIYVLVWTTTPWTLPSNEAVGYNSDFKYCLASLEGREDGELYIIANELVEATEMKLDRKLQLHCVFPGTDLKGIFYKHPFEKERILPLVDAKHVTLEKGTGLVHLAPAHGFDDFLVALENKLPVKCNVDEFGCYTSDIGHALHGLSVQEDGVSKVMDILKPDTLHTETTVHSYPYDWRMKKPVIIRASHQWFIDTDKIKPAAIEEVRNIHFVPKCSDACGDAQTFISLIKQRPYWCISRQRAWGVPIPVLYDKKTERPIISRELVEHYCHLLDHHGPDFWWTLPIDTLAPKDLLFALGIDTYNIERGKDILDIWFDSGISWSSVLGDERTADLYLEGVDQYNGWFLSSLLTSVALRGKSPYRTLFTHGFAVDEHGRKMSKSLGNVVNPQEVVLGGSNLKKQPAYGVDSLRWWVAHHGMQHSLVPASPKVLQAKFEEVHKIRIVLRFLLGSVHDLPALNVDQTSYRMLDRYLLHILSNFEKEVWAMYENYYYNGVCRLLINFIANDVSALYCHVIKDRLYCEHKDSPIRRACQTVMIHILQIVTRALAPILPFLAEEVYKHIPLKTDDKCFFFSEIKKAPEHWIQPDVFDVMSLLLRLRQAINKMSPVTNKWELNATLCSNRENLKILKDLAAQGELSELFQVSQVCVQEQENSEEIDDVVVQLSPAKGQLCPRCRCFTSENADHLCVRCQRVVDLNGISIKLL